MKVTVSTAQYEFSHGRLPRGRGNWAFIFPGHPPVFVVEAFGVARAEAVRIAKRAGISRIEVGP